MKFLEIPTFLQINALLNNIESFSGDSNLSGRIEAYSCKRAGSDKKLYKSLEEQYQVQLSKSPEAFEGVAVSPFGPLTESSSRKTLINLISILNASYPDYDFSNSTSEQFRKEASPYMVINSINTMLSNAIQNFHGDLGPKMWTGIDNEIRLKECDIYSYTPESDADPHAEEGQVPPMAMSKMDMLSHTENYVSDDEYVLQMEFSNS